MDFFSEKCLLYQIVLLNPHWDSVTKPDYYWISLILKFFYWMLFTHGELYNWWSIDFVPCLRILIVEQLWKELHTLIYNDPQALISQPIAACFFRLTPNRNLDVCGWLSDWKTSFSDPPIIKSILRKFRWCINLLICLHNQTHFFQ